VSSAEMLHGLPITLPGQFLEAIEPLASNFLQQLQDTVVTQLFPTQPVPACRSSDILPKGLMEASYVYLRRDGNKPPLAQLCQGPYAVVKRGPKVFHLASRTPNGGGVGGPTETTPGMQTSGGRHTREERPTSVKSERRQRRQTLSSSLYGQGAGGGDLSRPPRELRTSSSSIEVKAGGGPCGLSSLR
jgi:hypothetical protein